jgi:nitroreductase
MPDMSAGMNRRVLLIGLAGVATASGGAIAAWRASTGSMAEYGAYCARLRAEPASADVADLIRLATLAANSHNTQPWRFRIGNHAIAILPDLARQTPAVDPDDHHLFVSLGCAATNLSIAAAASGRIGEIEIAPDGAGVRYQFTEAAPRPEPLLGAITKRQSTRTDYDGRMVGAADLAALQAAAELPGVNLVLVTERPQMARIRDLVIAGNTAQMDDPAFMRELKHWLRFNPRSAMATGDGLFSAASGNPSLPTPLGRLAFDRLFNAASENDKYARQIDSSAGVAIFIGDEADRTHWIRVGQACQRFALEATRRGLKLAFINQPVEVARLRAELGALIGTTKRPDLVLRFGYGPVLPYAPRRPVDDVLGS